MDENKSDRNIHIFKSTWKCLNRRFYFNISRYNQYVRSHIKTSRYGKIKSQFIRQNIKVLSYRVLAHLELRVRQCCNNYIHFVINWVIKSTCNKTWRCIYVNKTQVPERSRRGKLMFIRIRHCIYICVMFALVGWCLEIVFSSSMYSTE